MNSEGANTPPEPPIESVRLEARSFPEHEDDDEPQRVLAGERLAHHRVAHAVHLWEREQHQAERDAADRGARPFRAALPEFVDEVLEPVQEGLEADADQPGREREHGHEQVGAVDRDNEVVRHLGEERGGAEERAADDIAGDRREAGREQSVERELAQHDLKPEEQPCDRRVERRGDPTRGAARDDDPQPIL